MKADQPGQEDLSVLLNDLAKGSKGAEEALIPVVYNELRRLAGYHLRREDSNHTLQATALVHEAFLKLACQHTSDWANRTHFMAVASELMRRILVDYARRRKRLKRGGGEEEIPADDAILSDEQSDEVLALDLALDRLSEKDPRQRRVVELRYFGGLTVDETAEALGVSTKTVRRDWVVARAWLHGQIAGRALTASEP